MTLFLVDYAALQTRVKDDLPMIEKRKRMLQTFLNRIAKHPELSRDHVFHRFLSSNIVWVRVSLFSNCKQVAYSCNSPMFSTLPLYLHYLKILCKWLLVNKLTIPLIHIIQS